MTVNRYYSDKDYDSEIDSDKDSSVVMHTTCSNNKASLLLLFDNSDCDQETVVMENICSLCPTANSKAQQDFHHGLTVTAGMRVTASITSMNRTKQNLSILQISNYSDSSVTLTVTIVTTDYRCPSITVPVFMHAIFSRSVYVVCHVTSLASRHIIMAAILPPQGNLLGG